MAPYLVKAPKPTVFVHPYTGEVTAQPNTYDWLIDNKVPWSLITESNGIVKFIFISEEHAALFLLRWS
jgi:hypothetical protein